MAAQSAPSQLAQFAQQLEERYKEDVQSQAVKDTNFMKGIGEVFHAACTRVDADKAAAEDSFHGAEKHVAESHSNVKELQQAVTEINNQLKGFYDKTARSSIDFVEKVRTASHAMEDRDSMVATALSRVCSQQQVQEQVLQAIGTVVSRHSAHGCALVMRVEAMERILHAHGVQIDMVPQRAQAIEDAAQDRGMVRGFSPMRPTAETQEHELGELTVRGFLPDRAPGAVSARDIPRPDRSPGRVPQHSHPQHRRAGDVRSSARVWPRSTRSLEAPTRPTEGTHQETGTTARRADAGRYFVTSPNSTRASPWTTGTQDSKNGFSDKIALTKEYQYDGDKSGEQWRMVVRFYLVPRTPEMEHILRTVEGREDSTTRVQDLASTGSPYSMDHLRVLAADLWGFLTPSSQEPPKGNCTTSRH